MISRKSLVTVAVVFILSIIVKTQILPLTIFVDSWPGLGEPDPDFNISLTVATLTDTRILGPDSDPPGRHIVDTSKNYKYIWQTAKVSGGRPALHYSHDSIEKTSNNRIYSINRTSPLR